MRVIEDYKFSPLSGGGVVLRGQLNGTPWRTTRIKAVHDDKIVMTESGSKYRLGKPHVSLWGLGIQMKRPKEFKVLSDKGCI